MATITLGLALFLVCLCNIAGAALTVTSLFPTGGNNQVATYVVTLTPTPGSLATKVKITDQVGAGPVATLGNVAFTLVNGVAKATVTKIYPTGPTFAVGSVDHKIQAIYPGLAAANFVHKLYNGQTATAVTLNKVSYVIGETITITAKVTKVSGQGTFTLPATGIAFQHNDVAFTCKVLTKVATGWTCTYLIPANEKTGSHKFTAIFQGIPAQKYGGSTGSKAATIGCSATVLDCNNDKVCETNIVTDVNHCGSCTTVCDLPNTNAQTCVNKVCTVGSCDLGFGNCNNTIAGCETPLNTVTNCGGCGQVCALPHSTPTCTNSGVCTFTTCDAGFKNCTADPGCETPTNTYENCGDCGVTCNLRAFPHAVASCITGVCDIDTCDAGWKNCNANPGCETHSDTDVNNCGGCNNVCPTTNGPATCVNGVCGFTCPSGFKDCDANLGCEANINADTQNCGDCGINCDLPNTATHTCKNGECQVELCDVNFGDCDCTIPGCETSLLTTTDCGSCGNLCTLPHATGTCATGTCQLSACEAGFLSCSEAPGCETDINDENNCGTCGHVCASIHGTGKCNSGVCSVTCDAGYQDCDGDPSTGCELDCSTSTPTITYATTLSEYPGTQTCSDAVDDLIAGGIPRFGTGNFNRNWVKATRNGIEIGLRAEERRVLDITPTFNNIYETIACPSAGKDSELENGGEARWNYGISVNLKGAAGILSGAKFGDFDIKLKIEPVGEKLNTFPIEIDVKDYLGGSLLKDICDSCSASMSFPFSIGSETFTGDCTTFYSTAANKQRAVNALNILQESSNLNFYVATFPFLENHEYRVTLTLTHLTLSCVCPLQVEMIVFVGFPSPDPTKCPLLTCDQTDEIDCDGDGKNGCETNKFSLANCGNCGIVCNPAHTPDASCSTGDCTFTTCADNWASCDSIASNGCEYAQNTPSAVLQPINIPQYVVTATCSDASSKLALGLLPRVGSGGVDGQWVTSQVDGIVIGLRAEERGQGTYPVNVDNTFYTYESYACKAYSSKTTDVIKKARWNYGFSVDLSGFNGGGSLTLADFDATITITAQTPIPTGVGEDTQNTVTLNVKGFGPGILGDVYGLSNPGHDHCFDFPFTVNGQQFSNIEELTAAQGGATDKLKLIQESTNIAFPPQFAFDATYDTVNVYDVTLTLTSKVACAPKSLSVSIRVNVVADPGVDGCVGGDTCCNLCNGCG